MFLSKILKNFDRAPQECSTIDLTGTIVNKEIFQTQILSSEVPILAKKAIPQVLCEKWSAQNLRTHLESRGGNLWITRGVADQGQSQFEEISIQNYLAYLFDLEKRKQDQEPMYVSISREFMQMLPDMVEEFGISQLLPPFYSKYPYAWLGPEGTVSGLHLDDYHSLFLQIWGSKSFILFPPSDTASLYVSDKYDWASKLSRVDLRQIEFNRSNFPSVRSCSPFVAEVGDSDLLWIPSGWFHFVYANAPTFSVTFFLANAFRFITHGIWEDWIKVLLHNLGIYGRKYGCTCH
jgi:hypothetical protein